MLHLGIDRDARRGLTAAVFGFLLDAYDLLLILSIVPIISTIFAPQLTGSLAIIASLAALVIALISRPIGSLIFGYLADRIGRRRVLVITILGFSLATFFTGVLPTYQQVGVLALILLYIVRAIQGIFIGGEYAAGNPFALEFAPQNRRGLVSGLLAAAFDAGVLLSSLVVFLISSSMSREDFINYGWRIAFFTGLIPAALGLYIRLGVPESRIWERIQEIRRKAQIQMSSTRISPWLYVSTSLLMAGFLYTYYSTVGFYSTLISNYLKYPVANASLVLTVTNGLILLAHLSSGILSDFVGRRPALILLGVLSIILAVPIFITLPSIASDFNTLLITLAVIGAIVNSAYAIHAAYITESYPTLRRGLGYGLSYALGLIIGGSAPLILVPLGTALGSIFVAIAINIILGQLLVVGIALARPETKGLSMER
ncbi:MAG: MFS transporter [Sulfolobales archaeon]